MSKPVIAVKVNGSWCFSDGRPTEKDLHIFTTANIAAGKITIPSVSAPKWIDWGDGVIETKPTGNTHTYATAGAFSIRGIFDWDNSGFTGIGVSIATVQQFGLNSLTGKRNQIADGRKAFTGLTSDGQTYVAVENLDVSNITDMSNMFDHSPSNIDLSKWDVSNVQSMGSMFTSTTKFNKNIGGWKTSNVINMNGMFALATGINQDLSKWCVSKIPTAPGGFAMNANQWVLPKPIWGTCP